MTSHDDKHGVIGANEAAVLALINTASDLERVETATAAFDLACKYGRQLDAAASAPSSTAPIDALRELVALKDIADKNHDWPNLQGDMDERDDYRRRKPIAWANARAVVAGTAPSATPLITNDLLDAILAHQHGNAWKKVYSLDYEATLRNDLRAVITTALRRADGGGS